MATTTTFAAIRDNMVTVIQALTPASLPDTTFKRLPANHELRTWALQNGSTAVFRRFQVLRGGSEEAPLLDPDAFERNEAAFLSVASPAPPGLGGPDDLQDLDDIMRADARALRDAIFSADNYLAGQSLASVTIEAPDRSDDAVWFQDFTIQLIYLEAQSL